jgi:hypothetical protein
MIQEQCTYLGDSAVCTCTQPVVPGRSYCEEHLWIVYKAGSAVVRRKDVRTANAVWDLQAELDSIVEELIEEGMDL